MPAVIGTIHAAPAFGAPTSLPGAPIPRRTLGSPARTLVETATPKVSSTPVPLTVNWRSVSGHSSGTPSPFWSRLIPSAMSQLSGMPVRLQSGTRPLAIATLSSTPSPSQSGSAPSEQR